jgi:peroxiredoxin
MKTKLLLTIVTSLAAASSLFAAESPRVGNPAPDFSLPDASGKTHSLADYKGKYVVLEWFNPECPFVKKHYNSENMQKLQQEAKSRGLVWLSIDSSAPGKEGNLTPEAAQKVMADWKIKSTALLLDPDGKVGEAYGAKNTPHMFVIDQTGKLIYEGAIDNKPSADPADIPTATNYVRAALTDAMAGQPVKNATTKPYGCSVKY